tara:strand:+ start:45 stop:911 length:867 start_codon:yes stop_codon:yes gene_type:complete
MSFGGGGGGGSQSPQEVTTTQTNLPPYVQPQFERLLRRGEAESLQGYTPYGGQRLAFFSPDELAAQAMTRGYAMSGTPSQFSDAESRIQNQMGFQEGIDTFMSPYQQAVTDVAKREAIRQSEARGDQIGSKAALSGGLGGYREAILQAEREKNLGQQLDDLQVRGSQAAFDRAANQFNRDQMMNLQSANFLRGLGGDINRDAMARIGALQGIGSQQRALQQAAFDTGYQDFLRQQDFAKQQLGFFSNLLRGVPVSPQQNVSTFQQQPGLFQQALGLGLGGLGLYRGLS